MEARSGAHHWARGFVAIGHEVRLIPPAYVKPFVKRQKNDAADAEPLLARQPIQIAHLHLLAEPESDRAVHIHGS
jgi:Transposase and inactivated derivatives